MLTTTKNQIMYGAYLLVVNLNIEVALPDVLHSALLPGFYGYVGNAKGYGGIQKRCERHIRKNKKKHWHIDWLTNHADKISTIAFPNNDECRILKYLLKIQNVNIALRGFGNSDCNSCDSHLVKLPKRFRIHSIKLPFTKFK
jgi:Uri superfamily endonuclease|tara:strand:+ start:586 stop:1011 length:426 start_codon:yes stop_codon:yes gene_type:complete